MNKIKLNTWSLLILPPLFFLINILISSIYYGVSGQYTDEQISGIINENIPLLLLISQIEMLGILLYYSKQNDRNILKETFTSNRVKEDIISGVFLGLFIALLYKFIISDFIIYLQNSIGDYVPKGSLNSLKGNLFIFGIANIILAPFVEENIYRNITLFKFQSKYGNYVAIIISSVFFGILHWLGGFWYMLATLFFIGIPFAIISVKRRNILLVFIAHLTLNILEFIM